MRRRRLSRFSGLIAVFALISSSLLPSPAASYQVKQGDTLWTIAAKHHTTVAKLAKANRISENAVLKLGKSLTIPGTAVTTRASQPARPSSYAVHTSASSVCLRSGPSTDARKVTTLAKGTTLKVLSRNGKWAKVATSSGVCGFVYRPLLAVGVGSAGTSTTQVASSQPTSDRSSLIETALACRGTSYRRGGTSRGGFDCSGFTRYVFAKYGVTLPHSSAAQAGRGQSIPKSDLRAGDLVFFQTSRRGISHVGIYLGNGNFVHAASRGRGVTVDSLNSSYYASRYRGARRVS